MCTPVGVCVMCTPVGEGVCVYVVNKTKDLPKLHRAVWKEDSAKVKSITSSIRKSVLNSYDKNKR